MVNIWHQLCVHVYELNILHFLHVCFFPPDVLGSTSIPHPARRWWCVVCLQPLAWRRRAVMITTWMPVWNTARKTCWNLSSTSTMMCCQSSEVLAKWFSLRWDESGTVESQELTDNDSQSDFLLVSVFSNVYCHSQLGWYSTWCLYCVVLFKGQL